ncbi:SprT-like domain-containing protein [Thermodesulfobacteriota bacterium]
MSIKIDLSIKKNFNNFAWELYWWAYFLNIAFFKDQPIPIPFITFEKRNVTNLGNYISERNVFGVKENININRAHLNRPLWDILATLLHEMVHSWQALYGNPSNSWFHNKEFQERMAQIGVICNGKGCHTAIGDPFVFLLKKHAVDFELSIQEDGIIKLPAKPKQKGKSKLKKWSCTCTNIRVAVPDLEARCLKCGQRFLQV